MDTVNNYVKEYIDYCRYRKRLDPKTIKAYKIDLTQYLTFGSTFSTCLSKNTLDLYLTYLHKNFKPKTVKRKIASLKAFFHYLEYQELLLENPFQRLDIHFREAKILPKTIPLHFIQRFFSVLYTEKENAKTAYQYRCCLRNIAVIELLFATGMRISELCSLKPSDIDLQNHNILIYGKGARERMIQVENSEVISAMTLYQNTFIEDINICGYYFTNRLHHKLSEQSVRNMITYYCELAEITQHITPHMFRHSFATLLLEQDVDIRYIQKMLGHSSISITEIYTHVSNTKQRDILVRKNPRNFININKG